MNNYIIKVTKHIMNGAIPTSISSILSLTKTQITYKLNEGEVYYHKLDAYRALEDYITRNLNGEFNDTDNWFYINNEKVYQLGCSKFIYDGIIYEITTDDDDTIAYEYCNECGNEQRIINAFVPQVCKECGKILLPCNMCESCVKDCPLAELTNYLSETGIEIVPIPNSFAYIRIDGVYFHSVKWIEDRKNLVGRKVFWVDPCFYKRKKHTSDWKTIKTITDEMVRFTDGTEALLTECYI